MAENSKMPANDLSQRLRDEADLCRNDGAQDIANLLDEAAAELEAQARVAICPRGHDWHDFGSLGGRKVSWCPRCDILAYTGREPPSAAPPAPAAQAEPQQGWKLAPVEATRNMMAAAVIYANGNAVYKNVPAAALEIEESIYGEVYAAMIANTPPAPAAQAERVPTDQSRGTNAQILKEREITASAISGAIAFGYLGSDPPPADSAWLQEFYDLGARIKVLEALATQPTEAQAERAAALETNYAANAMLRAVNRMVEASNVGDDALVAMAEQIRAEAERMSREATGVLIRSKTKDATQSTSTTGGA